MGRPRKPKNRDEVQFNVGIPRRLSDEATEFFESDASMDKKQHGAAMLHHYVCVATDDERLRMFAAFRKWLQRPDQIDCAPGVQERAAAEAMPVVARTRAEREGAGPKPGRGGHEK